MKKTIGIIIAGIVLIMLSIIIFFNIEKNKDKPLNEDEIKFKSEYEELNGTIREKDGHIYNDVEISVKNPMVYITLDELVNILNNGEGFVFISNPTCPYCRASIPSLLKVAKKLKIDKIYYYDTQNWNENYKELVKTLLENGIVKRNEEGNDEWNIPQLLNIRNGKIISSLKGTAYKLNNGQTKYDKLTEEQENNIYKAYYEILSNK